jgi:predicted ATPase/class 3 adenylate cyclase
VISCPSCGQENPEGFRLCGMCGASLASEAAAREERKIVTVLFCDLVGFTAKAEQLDPEDVRAVLGPYHMRVRSELERHGGTVEKFIGDAVMALFGAPVAHEDDPERAVRAALAIRDFAVEEKLELRVGITTGEALVSLDASPLEGEGMASGDVVNTAARLQSAAPVNGILVDETTHRATRHALEYRDAPPVEAKGKTEPIRVWEATGAKSRFGVDVTHTARAELVGRERELSVLRDALDRARHERIPQLVTLVGVPGMGKSRLVYELSRIVDADPEIITWRQGRCLAYGDGIAFWALGEVVKAQAGVLERDTETEAAAKLRTAVDDVFGKTSDAGWVESHLRPLVGLEAETGFGGDRRGEAFAAWRRFLEALAEQRPFVLVLEDLHWADDGLLDFVDELVDWLTGVPLAVVCTARPELLERRPGWSGGKLNASTVGLSPLSQEQTAVLISRVLERAVLPAETQQRLLERSDGNPLYAEQFAQLYLERGAADDLPLPETLQGIIAARLDGLSSNEKTVLQDASVMGKVFWTGAVRRDERETIPLLHALERKGFLTRQRSSSIEGEGEWAFAHMLLRDVAYGQIPRAERAAKHRAAAMWIESLGRPDDHAELLALHWRSALELTRAAGQSGAELTRPTRLALQAAGDRAFSVNAYASAAAYYGDAVALGSEGDEGRPELLSRYGEALKIADPEHAFAALEVARDAQLAVGDRDRAAEAELALAEIWWNRGQTDESRIHLAHAEELVRGASSRAAARVLAYVARKRFIEGDPSHGLELATQALQMAEALELADVRAHALATVGSAKADLGDPTGMRDLERALRLAIDANAPFAGHIANNLAAQAISMLDLRRADEAYDEQFEIAERFGYAAGLRWNRGERVVMASLYGRWDEALELAGAFIAECEAGSPHYLEASVRRERALILLGRGDARALAEHERAIALARDVGDPQMVLPNLGAATGAFEALARRDDARELAVEVVALARSYPQVAVTTLPLEFLLTRVALEFVPDLREAFGEAPPWPWKDIAFACLDRDFVRGAEIWSNAGIPTSAARYRLRAAEELVEAGRRAEGEEQAAQALAFYRVVRATFYVERCEALLRETKSA